jgi:hypothetical protein
MKHLIEPLLEKYTDADVRNVLKKCVVFDKKEMRKVPRLRRLGEFVYFLISENEIKYIGQTTQIEQRVKYQGETKPKFELVFFCRVLKGQCDTVERFLINSIRPEWNKQFFHPKNRITNEMTHMFNPDEETQQEVNERLRRKEMYEKFHLSIEEDRMNKADYKKPISDTYKVENNKNLFTKKVIGQGLCRLIDKQQNDFYIGSNNLNQSQLNTVLELKDLIITNLENTINKHQATNDALQKQVCWLQGQIEFLQQHIIK